MKNNFCNCKKLKQTGIYKNVRYVELYMLQ